MEKFNSFASDQIVITKRQMSMVMASMLLFCLFVFIIGFFLGRKTVIDEFSSKTTKESLHDQIDFLLTTQSLQSSKDDVNVHKNSDFSEYTSDFMSSFSQEQPSHPLAIVQAEKNQENFVVAAQPIDSVIVIAEQSEKKEEKSIQDDKKSAYAQLIGFGTKKAAQTFVNRLKKHHVPVILKTVISKTSSGSQRTWYQAITPTYQSVQELHDQITIIKRLEHIRDTDIKIVMVQ